MRERLGRLLGDERVRFLLVGGFNTAFAYGLFVLFEFLTGGMYLLSLGLSYGIATLVAFGLHRAFTFRVTGRSHLLLDLVRFEGVYLMMFVVNAILLIALVDLAVWRSEVAQAAIVVVTTVLSYLGHRYFSFRRSVRHANSKETKRRTGA